MRQQQASDLLYWLSRPMAERIAAVDALRTQAPNEPKPLDAEPRLQRICRVAQRSQLVIGGYALAAHGHPRFTGDIDFWVRPSAQNIERLLDVLQDFGFGSLGLVAGDFNLDAVVQFGQPPRRIDLLTAIDGVEFEIALEDFKINKRASGRTKDLADLESLGSPRDSDPDAKAG